MQAGRGLPAGAASAQTGPDVTFDPTGVFYQDGAAAISGTYSCGDFSGFAFIEASLSQRIGRVATVGGTDFAEIPVCTPGATGTWFARIFPSTGKFKGGPALAGARIVIDGTPFEVFTATVHLVGHQPG